MFISSLFKALYPTPPQLRPLSLAPHLKAQSQEKSRIKRSGRWVSKKISAYLSRKNNHSFYGL